MSTQPAGLRSVRLPAFSALFRKPSAALDPRPGRIRMSGDAAARGARAAVRAGTNMSPFPMSSSGAVVSSAPSRPSELVRAAVGVAILLYLVGLVLAIAGNSASGSSALVRVVKGRLFSPWMAPAWLDIGFDYRLTYGGPEDGCHELEIRPYGGAKAAAIQLPGTSTGERAARWRRLARVIAREAEASDRDAAVAAAVGRGMFGALGRQDVVVNVQRYAPVDRGGVVRPPATVASARVRMVDGELQMLRSEARGEVAPLVRPRAVPPSVEDASR